MPILSNTNIFIVTSSMCIVIADRYGYFVDICEPSLVDGS
jgi:hypothetical protein